MNFPVLPVIRKISNLRLQEKNFGIICFKLWVLYRHFLPILMFIFSEKNIPWLRNFGSILNYYLNLAIFEIVMEINVLSDYIVATILNYRLSWSYWFFTQNTWFSLVKIYSVFFGKIETTFGNGNSQLAVLSKTSSLTFLPVSTFVSARKFWFPLLAFLEQVPII